MKKPLSYGAALTLVLTLGATSCSTESPTPDNSTTTPTYTGPTTEFVGLSSDTTRAARTSIQGDLVNTSVGNQVDVWWETGDKIWLEDGSNALNNDGTTKTTTFVFNQALTAPTYQIYYTGTNSQSKNTVNILATQTQTQPNDSKHIGTSGDCGVATATRQADGRYGFTLDHKIAVLCLLPFSKDEYHSDVRVQSVTITDNAGDLFGTYDLTSTGLSGTNPNNKTITMNLGANNAGFQLTNIKRDQNLNAIYTVIKPGQRTLNFTYTVVDTLTKVSYTAQKTVTANFESNKVYPVGVNLTQNFVRYDKDDRVKYYMRNSLTDYWANATTVPKVVNETGSPKPTAGSPSWWRPVTDTSGYLQEDSVINANEAMWYIHGGGYNDTQTIWMFYGHLYVGGTWHRKWNTIPSRNGVAPNRDSFPTETATNTYVNEDYRLKQTTVVQRGNSLTLGIPTNKNDYFFLPKLGWINGNGTLTGLASRSGNFWVYSSVVTNPTAGYYFYITFGDYISATREYSNRLNLGYPYVGAQVAWRKLFE